MTSSPKAEVVLGSEFRALLKLVLDQHMAQHPTETVFKGAKTGMGWMADQIGVTERSLFRNMYQEEYVSLAIADKYLAKLNLHLDSYLRVIPNPEWSQEDWQEWMARRGCI